MVVKSLKKALFCLGVASKGKVGNINLWQGENKNTGLIRRKKQILPQKITWPLKIHRWKMNFPLGGRPFFHGQC